jgi:hypothetical protein
MTANAHGLHLAVTPLSSPRHVAGDAAPLLVARPHRGPVAGAIAHLLVELVGTFLGSKLPLGVVAILVLGVAGVVVGLLRLGLRVRLATPLLSVPPFCAPLLAPEKARRTSAPPRTWPQAGGLWEGGGRFFPLSFPITGRNG